MTTPDAVVNAARGWIGVPFAHQGRSREGVDCAGLVICVCRELGIVPATFDVQGYGRQPDGSMLQWCLRHMRPASHQPAGVAMMRFADEPQHLALLARYRFGGLSVIHALQRNAKVVEHRLDDLWQGRIVQTFALPGVAD